MLKFESKKTQAKLIILVRLIAIKVNQEINHFVKNKSSPFREVLLAVLATNYFPSKDVYGQITFLPNFKLLKSVETLLHCH